MSDDEYDSDDGFGIISDNEDNSEDTDDEFNLSSDSGSEEEEEFGDFSNAIARESVVPPPRTNLPPMSSVNLPPILSGHITLPPIKQVQPIMPPVQVRQPIQPIIPVTPLVQPITPVNHLPVTPMNPVTPVNQVVPSVSTGNVWMPTPYTLLGMISPEEMRLRKGVSNGNTMYANIQSSEAIVRRAFPKPKRVSWLNEVSEGFNINHSNMNPEVTDKLTRCYINKLEYGCNYPNDIESVINRDIVV